MQSVRCILLRGNLLSGLMTPTFRLFRSWGEALAFLFVIFDFFLIKHLVFIVKHSNLLGFKYYLLCACGSR